MARPKSEEKRNAILTAATEVFATGGLSAPTSAVSAAAGVAEGTLFTYFSTKDDLLNELYRHIKLAMAESMLDGFPRTKGIRRKMQHVWERYLEWGVANPLQYRALKQIEVWSGLTAESKKAGALPFAEIQKITEEAAAKRLLKEMPRQFFAASMAALAETTMEFMRQHPRDSEKYKKAGFEMLFAGVSR